MDTTVLEVKNLTKKFKDFTAVDNISFDLKEGEILGLLGPNGAGKTTTLQMLLGVLTPTSGDILYFGKKFPKHREEILEQVNFSSTYTNLPWNITVKENLTWVSYLYKIKNRKERVEKIIETFKLQELYKQTVGALSAGQLTRVNLAKAFINYPKVLLLDEPTASLDPDVASYIRQFLLEERKEFQTSIIITSHNMSEVEEMCDRVVFINRGQIIADDSPSRLAQRIETVHVELSFRKGLHDIKDYAEKKEIVFKTDGNRITLDVKEKNIPDLLEDLVKQKILYDEISIEKPTLEDYFLQVATKTHETT